MIAVEVHSVTVNIRRENLHVLYGGYSGKSRIVLVLVKCISHFQDFFKSLDALIHLIHLCGSSYKWSRINVMINIT